ncbi:hypothetical protein Poly41_60510 [Novipirellula artificiosorum]|uniref:Uncharacterized protein n=2 Tax=Novipirellula artificiosorum TaxID=2528016 RepID=A0A5C6D9B8_9BACT|nr:hypothetical protein Poly41_60510 [Novipirellula artificiosorum]
MKGCIAAGLEPDFWMKTLHKTNYWSATDTREQDNLWCEDPEQTIAFMKTVKQPWIAFKTMSAGALKPEDAFGFAFENGADFVCAGMYDFQFVEDVNLAVNVLNGPLPRGHRLESLACWSPSS